MKDPKGKRWVKTRLPLGIGERVGFTDKGQAVYMFVIGRYTGTVKPEDIIAESDIRSELMAIGIKRNRLKH